MNKPFRSALAAALLVSTAWGAEQPPRPTINVKDFGAKGDCRHVMDGAMRKGSAELTSASVHFTAEDIGKSIYVLGAAVQKFPELGEVPGAPLSSRIDALPEATVEFRGSSGVNCAKYSVAPKVTSTDNDLR